MSEPDQLRDSIDEYLSGHLDGERFRQLEALLRADAEARAYFVRYCRFHTDLHLEVRARRAAERAVLRLGDAPAGDARRPRPVRGRWLLRLAAAVLLAAGVAGWLATQRFHRPAPALPEEVAWLVNAQDCQWGDDTALDGAIRAGSVLRIERGLAEIRFRSGAKVVLEGPASLELLSANSARLLQGRLAARVPPSAVGFEVVSPQGKVIDLGTEFGVAVGANGATEVVVFEGQVIASGGTDGSVNLGKDQTARIAGGGVALRPAGPNESAGRYVRAIVPPPVVVPRTVQLDFARPAAGTLADADGRGTGLTHRLPGTGQRLANRDANLCLNTAAGRLELTTTNSDINRQYQIDTGEYLGFRLADLGFTGSEDFAVSATVVTFPALKRVGQFGLYAGTRSDANIRGGVFSPRPGEYTQNFVNNHGGRDSDSHFVGLFTPGDDVRLTLQRRGGKYSLTVENQSTGGASTLSIRHPDFLDGERDLYVGLFGANTQSEDRKTLFIKELHATVWTLTRPGPAQ